MLEIISALIVIYFGYVHRYGHATKGNRDG
jgi:hypothetical protein